MFIRRSPVCCALSALLWMAAAPGVHAAEGFNLRHNLRAGMDGSLFVEPEAGFAGTIAYTHLDVRGVVGEDGKTLSRPSLPGTFTVTLPKGSTLRIPYGSSTATVNASASAHVYVLGLGYTTQPDYAGGRLQFAAMLPYVKRDVRGGVAAAAPALQFPAAVPVTMRPAITANFNRQFQQQLAAKAAESFNAAEGLGNMELGAAWIKSQGPWRVNAGVGVVLPTASDSIASAGLLGVGRFYTVRPSVQLGYLVTPELGLSGRLSAGFNSRNHDSGVRSGTWAGAELGAAYKSAIGVWGAQLAHFQQVQDDSNNPWGSGRYRSSHAGLSYQTRIPGVDAILGVQYMANMAARNAAKANSLQVRLTKTF